MDMENKANYYAIIPANVRYDKNLSASAKLLYGEITALCNEKGYCWASNDYFANLYGVSKQSISSWVRQLKEKGYISAKIKYKKNSKKILNRVIKIFCIPTMENFKNPTLENFKENNTSINNTPPLPPQGEKGFNQDELLKTKSFSGDVTQAVKDWLLYKAERKDKYTPTGLKKLLSRIENKIAELGEQAVIEIIDESISNQWQGITWAIAEKLKPKDAPKSMADIYGRL